LDIKRKKRLFFRCHHCGMQETDAILGGFVERHLDDLTDGQIERFETLMEESDNDLFNWISGKEKPPKVLDNDIMKMIKRFRESM
jgi:antitoxin CptB